VVQLLLAHEASTNILDVKGSSPLHLAAWTGNVDIVRLLLCRGPSVPNVNLTVSCVRVPLIVVLITFYSADLGGSSHLGPECCGRVVSTPASYLGGPGFKFRLERPSVFTELFLCILFYSPSKKIPGIAPFLGHYLFLPHPFQFIIHYHSTRKM
jgi:hypothetical protein